MTTIETLPLDRAERREIRQGEAPQVMLAYLDFIRRESAEHHAKARAAGEHLNSLYAQAEQLRKELAAYDQPRSSVPSKAEVAQQTRKQKALDKILGTIAEGEAAKKAEQRPLNEESVLTHLDNLPSQFTLVPADPFQLKIRKGESALDALNQVREAIDGRRKQYYGLSRRPPMLAEAVETALASLPKNRPALMVKDGFLAGNFDVDRVTLSDILGIALDVAGPVRSREWLADMLASQFNFKDSVTAADRAAELAELKSAVTGLIREEVALVFAARRAGFDVGFRRLSVFNVFGEEFERVYFLALLGVELAPRIVTISADVEAA